MKYHVCTFLIVLLFISCKRDTAFDGQPSPSAREMLRKAWGNIYNDSTFRADTLFRQVIDASLTAKDTGCISSAYLGLAKLSILRNDSASFSVYKDSLFMYSVGNAYIANFLNIADIYTESGLHTQSELYYKKAVELIKDRDPDDLSQIVLDKIVRYYTEQHNSKEAFRYLDLFRHSVLTKHQRAYSLLARGNIWKSVFQFDSAFHYYTLASQSTNKYVATVALEKLADLYVLDGKYSKAVSSLQNYKRLLTDEDMSIQTEEMKVKYQEEKVKNVMNEMKLAKRSRELFIVVLSALVLLALVAGYVFYLRSKNMLLKHSKEVSTLREKEATLREALFRKMSVSRKIPSLDNNDDLQSGNKRIALLEDDWKEIVLIVNDSYDHFAERLQANFPLLTEKDIRFCCLVKINVTLKDLSDIYCVSKSAITKKKFRIKTEKIGFRESDQSLDDFLQSF